MTGGFTRDGRPGASSNTAIHQVLSRVKIRDCSRSFGLRRGVKTERFFYTPRLRSLPQRRTAAVLWMILMQCAAYERLLDLSQQLRAFSCLAPLAPLLRLARLAH